MRKALLSLLIVGLSFFGFSNAQFVESVTPSCSSYSNICSFNDFLGVSFGGEGAGIRIYVQGKTGSSRWNVSVPGSYDCPCGGESYCSNNLSKSDLIQAVVRQGENPNDILGVFYDGSCSVLNFNYKTSKMPVSEFSPVLSGLTNTISEFIPYIVYIGLGILVAVIGFVAIKRLINWVRAKIFSSFK